MNTENNEVRCNNCGWVGDEEELEIFKEEANDYFCIAVCPFCKTDAFLRDID